MISIVAGFFASIIMPAQNLPVLPADPAVKTGILPNGLNYYIVSNRTKTGVADFALVQKTGLENIDDTASYKAVAISRESLSVLPRCGSSSSQVYFTSHGATFGKDGFVKVMDNATVYRFNNVLLSHSSDLDSTLLVMLDIVDRVSHTDDPFMKKWYAPSDQAMIVSGDVDASSVVEKLRMISLMTPKMESSPRIEYLWQESDTAVYVMEADTLKGYSDIELTWSSTRPRRELMNTIQPAISEMFMAELGMIISDRIKEEMFRRSIPCDRVVCRHISSLQSSGDELFTVRLSVSGEDFMDALSVVSGVLSEIDSGKTDVNDLLRVKRICLDHINFSAHDPVVENSDYVDKCIDAFLYNGSLATLKSKVEYLAGRQMEDTVELRLFNGIASALLDPERNLKVKYSYDCPPDSVRKVFVSSWNAADTLARDMVRYTSADIPVHDYDGPKMKIRTEKADHMSGGVQWTFSNGFRVVYKRMTTHGRLYYNLALNGGYGSVEDLQKGEGGYFSDCFMLARINGMPVNDFMKVLDAEGMSLDTYVGLTKMMISGSLPDDKIDMLLNALLTVIYGREHDEEAFDYYVLGEELRSRTRKGTMYERRVKINEIMCPDYRYTSLKMLDALSPDLPVRAEKLFAENAERMNDGVLILLGDVDENMLKKKLLNHVGCFRTTDRAFRRPLVRYQPSSGWSTYTVGGKKNRIDVALSASLPLTSENHMAAEIAAMVLKKSLSEAITDTGMYLELLHECRIYPHERMNVHIAVNETSPDGFSSDVEHTGPIEALSILRDALNNVSSTDVVKEDVEFFKRQLKEKMNMEMRDPYYWLNVISRRHLAGKDFTSGHEARIDAVSVEDVKRIISYLNEGTRVEYIVSAK